MTAINRENQVLAMWKKEGKDGKQPYFTSKGYVGFYNSMKKNPKEPDVKIYKTDEKGKAQKDVYLSLWCNVTDKGVKYLAGKLDGKRVVGFINNKGNTKQPYFSVYWSEETPVKEEVKPVSQMTTEEISNTLAF